MSLKKMEAKSDFTSGMKPVSQKRKLRQAIESLSKTTHCKNFGLKVLINSFELYL